MNKLKTNTYPNKFNTSEVKPVHHWRGLMFLLFYFLIAPNVAYAGPIEDGLDWMVELLTSGIARSVAIIAVAALGYYAWAGKLTWEAAFKTMGGIVLVFGAATLVDTFSGAIA
ncbi:TrbC/VirB2 family protein [Marinobacterium arenosum]|uniref:TrbC/VirB2 family protein n=1 Tax=Marinobacterium arenosum TaxID=2862496 RepID=UPI001C956E7A|nr:TrbC/VirB2 family protein [Marinobacterium arenosum]MBY4679116.1 TrbC/VirB2 family protein [Marinobacterium arenosum]